MVCEHALVGCIYTLNIHKKWGDKTKNIKNNRKITEFFGGVRKNMQKSMHIF